MASAGGAYGVRARQADAHAESLEPTRSNLHPGIRVPTWWLTRDSSSPIVAGNSQRLRPGRVRVRASSESRVRCEPVLRQTLNGPASFLPNGAPTRLGRIEHR